MVEREQVADRVLVFGAAQAMEQRELAGSGLSGGGAVDFGLEKCSKGIVGRGVGPGRAGWRHGGRPQLSDRFFPVGGVRTGAWRLGRIDDETGGFEGGAVAGRAVFTKGGRGIFLRESGGGHQQRKRRYDYRTTAIS